MRVLVLGISRCQFVEVNLVQLIATSSLRTHIRLHPSRHYLKSGQLFSDFRQKLKYFLNKLNQPPLISQIGSTFRISTERTLYGTQLTIVEVSASKTSSEMLSITQGKRR